MKNAFLAINIVAGILFFGSCSPSKNTVVEQPVAPVYERPATPGPAYVWIDGDWRWHNEKYIYYNGYWAKPKPNKTYVPGTWLKTDKGYYWQKGYWKK